MGSGLIWFGLLYFGLVQADLFWIFLLRFVSFRMVWYGTFLYVLAISFGLFDLFWSCLLVSVPA